MSLHADFLINGKRIGSVSLRNVGGFIEDPKSGDDPVYDYEGCVNHLREGETTERSAAVRVIAFDRSCGAIVLILLALWDSLGKEEREYVRRKLDET